MIALMELISDNILKSISSYNLFLLKFKVNFDKLLRGEQFKAIKTFKIKLVYPFQGNWKTLSNKGNLSSYKLDEKGNQYPKTFIYIKSSPFSLELNGYAVRYRSFSLPFYAYFNRGTH